MATTKKKTTTKKTTKKKPTTPKKVIKNSYDDELKTSINIPIVEDYIDKKKKKANKLHNYDLYGKPSNKKKKRKKDISELIKNIIKNIKKNKKKKIKKATTKTINKKTNSNKKTDFLDPDEFVKIISKNKRSKITNEEESINLLNLKKYKGFKKIRPFFINRLRVIKSDMKKFNRKFKYGTLKDKILIILMLLLISGFTCIIIFCGYIIATAPEISEKRLYKTNSSILLDKNGNEIARLGIENREKVTYDDLPEVLIDAIIATEDSRYFQHNGIDIARFTKASFGQLLGHSDAGGGSTLTMQISKNAATNNKSSGIKGIVRKFQDIYLAVFVFEKKFTKEQIFEFYVNLPYLGSSTYGVEQASQTYFGKSVTELTLPEAALIAGLFQSPSAYDPYVHPERAQKRRDTVLNLMQRHEYITKEECEKAKSINVSSMLVGTHKEFNRNMGFIDTVVEEVIRRTKTKYNPNGDSPDNVSMKVYTTMDPEKQEVINQIMYGETYSWKNEFAEAGIVAIDVKDGSVVGVGAGRNQKHLQRANNYATSARRHPGSTAKPVLDYGPAFEYLNWSTGQTVVDDKMTYSSGGNIKNFDNGYKGIMTAKTALAQSRNIPALYTFQQTTNEQKVEFSNNLGWKPEDDGAGTLIESCSIGGFEGVTPMESAAAYATFARGGTYIEPYTVTKIEYLETGDVINVTPKKVLAMSEETAYLITVALKYAVTSGVVGAGSVSGTDIAAKTGTSTIDAKVKKSLGIKGNVVMDSWEAAYSPDYAVATWYGYPKLSKDHYLINSEGGAARKAITRLLTKGIFKKDSKFVKPAGIVTAEIELQSDPLELASPYTPAEFRSTEYFKKGTVPTSVSERFAQLSNPSNLKFSTTNNQVTLTWSAAPTPTQMNREWLVNYFNESSAYKYWGEKYADQRLSWAYDYFGSFGYHIYMTNAYGTYDLGFTTNTSFTANVQITSDTTFTVKSSYQKFTSNMSPGISAKVTVNAQATSPATTQAPTAPANNNFSIEYIGQYCLDGFNSLGPQGKDKIRIISNGKNVTENASINYECYDPEYNPINCTTLTSGNEYIIKFNVRYANTTRTKDIKLNTTC